jgi:hypothetical protein
MKNYINSLVPFAAFALFGACMAGLLGVLVILMTSVGWGHGLPLLYFQKLNIPALSVALPIIGMILFAAILLGISGQSDEVLEPTVIEGATSQLGSGEEAKAGTAAKSGLLAH